MVEIKENQLKRLQNIAKIIALVALLSLGIIIVLLALGYWEIKKNDEEIFNKRTEVNRVSANLILLNANLMEANENLMAKEKEIENKNTRVSDLQKTIANLEVNIANKEMQIKDREAELKTSNDQIKKSYKEDVKAAESQPRIFIQIREESQRNPAKTLQKKLQDRGFIVPGIENVDGTIEEKTSLRYCKGTEKDDDFKNIKSLINIGIFKPLSMKECDKAGVRSYELWLEGDFYIKK